MIPKYIRCYDSTKTIDRYTVVFTGDYRHNTGGQFIYLAMSGSPTHPQGFCQHGSSNHPIDRPSYAHLGKEIDFTALPEECQKIVVADYQDLWSEDVIYCLPG